jgi:hypothetical protein
MTKKPPEDKLPDRPHELIHADDLVWGEFNNRYQDMDESTVKSIKKTGLREPLLVRKEDDGYHIKDGWNRYQCLVHQMGWSHVPCKVVGKYEAFRETDRITNQNSHTKFQDIKEYGMWVTELMNDYDMSLEEAIDRVYDNSSASKQTIKKRVQIYNLPEPIHVMLKKPENRGNTWELQAEYPFHKDQGPLNLYSAKQIAKGYFAGDFDDERAIQVAMECLNRNGEEMIKEAISECRERPKDGVEKVFDDVQDRYKNPNRSQKTISVGSIHLGEDAETIFEYIAHERSSKHKVVKEALQQKAEELREEYPYLDKVEI